MAQIGRLEVSLALLSLFEAEIVIPRIDVQTLDLALVRDAANRANWDFADDGDESQRRKPAKLPVVRSFRLDRGRVEIVDAVRKLRFSGTIAASQGGDSRAQSLHLDGSGELNGAPFTMTTTGDPLITAERAQPYNFTSDIRAGRTHLGFAARIAKPFDLGSLTARFSVSGADLADVYYLTGLTLPNTPAYKISGELERDGTRVNLSNLAGLLGNSDLNGTMVIETAAKRPFMTADLSSRSLDISDLGPALGAPANATAAAPIETKSASKRRRALAIAPLLPDEPLDVERVRGMDADVHYRALSVNAQKIPFKRVAFRLRLDHGVMTIDPLSFVLPAGAVAARLRIDASRDLPDVDLDGRLSAVELTQFHAAGGEPPLQGLLLARVSVHGKGRSVHAVASTANGMVTAVVPHGEVRSAFAELTGINVARGLGLILTKDQKKAQIRCAIADFKSADGIMTAQNIVMDTQNVRITAKGSVNMRSETLDLSINGQPKKVRFATLKSPIIVHGALRRPSVALEPGHVAKQTAMAVALGAIVTPLAAVLAFIDPGLAKDADCGALLAEARAQGVTLGANLAPSYGKATR
jgi:hypothetical protein